MHFGRYSCRFYDLWGEGKLRKKNTRKIKNTTSRANAFSALSGWEISHLKHGVLGTGFFGNKNPPYPSQWLMVKCKLLFWSTCRAPSKPRRSPEVKEVPPGAPRNAALSRESTGAPGMPPLKNCRKAWFFWLYVDVTRMFKVEGVSGDCFGMIFIKMFHCLSEVEKGKVKGWLLGCYYRVCCSWYLLNFAGLWGIGIFLFKPLF